jgi:hypothetical protein
MARYAAVIYNVSRRNSGHGATKRFISADTRTSRAPS